MEVDEEQKVAEEVSRRGDFIQHDDDNDDDVLNVEFLQGW